MRGYQVGVFVRRAAVDVTIGLGVFIAFAGVISGIPSLSDLVSVPAEAGELAKAAAHSVTLSSPVVIETKVAAAPSFMVEASAKEPGRALALMLLAGVFTALFAFNLAFFRHLSRAYASPRRQPRKWLPWSVPKGRA